MIGAGVQLTITNSTVGRIISSIGARGSSEATDRGVPNKVVDAITIEIITTVTIITRILTRVILSSMVHLPSSPTLNLNSMAKMKTQTSQLASRRPPTDM